MAQPDRPGWNGARRTLEPPTVSVLVAGRSGGDVLVRIVGRLDRQAAPRVARELATLGRPPRRTPLRLTLDLSGVSYLDEAGLTVLLNLQDRLLAQSGDLELQAPTAAVVRLLHETYLHGAAGLRSSVGDGGPSTAS
jgi:anti-sigma B factor antagonist